MADQIHTRGTLLLRLCDDDTMTREIAWDEFKNTYGPIIAGFARKLSVRGADIDDIIQDVMLGFFAHSPTFVYDPARGRFRGYLKVCTFRAMQRRLGGRTKFAQVSLDQVDPESIEVEHVWKDVWEEERLNRAMARTRDSYENNKTFQAFELLVVRGQDVESVARTLNLSADSVYKARKRVAQSLRQHLESLQAAEG